MCEKNNSEPDETSLQNKGDCTLCFLEVGSRMWAKNWGGGGGGQVRNWDPEVVLSGAKMITESDEISLTHLITRKKNSSKSGAIQI